ncbi:MAG TPA: hypothetical protein VGQ78_04795 [Vicinamibacteria bacterium]|nr:hypothetical protein [Vicinamibacteria bacterium]
MAGSAVLAIMAASSPARSALIALEPAAPAALFLAGAVLAVPIGRWARARRRLEVRTTRALVRWGWAGAVLLFLVPLWSHWAMRPPSRVTAFAALFGHLPWADAHGHYEGGTRLLAEGRFGGFSERRPFHAAWLAVRLALTRGHLMPALALQAVATALAAWLAARAVGRRYGIGAAIAAFGVLLGLSRDYLPAVVTEPLGIGLASLALVALLAAGTRTRLATAVAGLFLLALALQARPGAQLVLPLVALWVVIVHRRRLLLAVAASVLVIVIAGAHSSLLNALYGAGEASPVTYPAFTLYGLAHNTTYEQAYRDFGAEIDRLGEKRAARDIYAASLRHIREKPSDLLAAVADNAREFVSKLHIDLARILSPYALFAPYERRAQPEDADIWRDRWVGGAVVVLAAAGFAVWMARVRTTLDFAFWIAVLAGTATSAALIFGDAGFRGLAAVYPFLAAALAIGVRLGRRRGPTGPATVEEEGRDVRSAAVAGCAMLALTVGGPAVAHALAPRPPALDRTRLAPDQVAVIDPRTAPRVLVTSRGHTHPGIATLNRSDFIRLARVAAFGDADEIASLRPPVVLLSAFDFVAGRQRLIVAPQSLLRSTAPFVKLAIQPLGESRYFVEAMDWSPL